MKKIFYLAVLFILFIGCNNDDNGEEIFTPQTITPIPIAMGGYAYLNDFPPYELNLIFTNAIEWNSFWSGSNYYPETNVDFTQHMVICCIDRGRPTPGYFVTIHSVIECQETIIVDVEYYGSGWAAQVPSRPFIIVKIPKTEKPIIFE